MNCAATSAPSAHELDVLALIARLPLISAHQLARILGERTQVHRHLRRARRRALVAAVGCQHQGFGRPAQLLRVTPRGRRLLTEHALDAEQSRFRSSRRDSPHQLTTLLACYELLSELSQTAGGSARVIAWEQPWQRAYRSAGGHGLRRVTLPAAVTLAWSLPGEDHSRSYLLLPDLGGIDLRAWRSHLLDLVRLQEAYRERVPELAIVTSSETRARAWQLALIDAAASTSPSLPLACTISVASIRAGLAYLTPSVSTRRQHSTPGLSMPASARDLQLLDVVGRHPFLTTTLLVSLLGQDQRSVRGRFSRLIKSNLVRIVPAAELGRAELESDPTLELTQSGLLAVAASLGLPPATAVRVHALTGGGAIVAFGPRQMLLAHAAHTQEADRVIVGLAAVARRDGRGAYLAEWRSAAACAHGRLRPDAYGLLRLAGHDCGFFLELDRATMRPSKLRAKFVAYHRFRTSRRARELYTSFPTVLVITSGPGAERRLADAVRAVDDSFASPLPVLLTTTAWINAHALGMLGPIWRQPHATARLCWPRLNQERVLHAH